MQCPAELVFLVYIIAVFKQCACVALGVCSALQQIRPEKDALYSFVFSASSLLCKAGVFLCFRSLSWLSVVCLCVGPLQRF